MQLLLLVHDVASGCEITPCTEIEKPLVVYKFPENVMKSIKALLHNDKMMPFLRQEYDFKII